MVLSALRVVAVAATISAASGQWVNYPAPGVLRTPDGQPDLTAPAPMVGGKPDFAGLWQPEESPPGVIEKLIPGLGELACRGTHATIFPIYLFTVMADYQPGEIEMSPEAQEMMAKYTAEGDHGPLCLPQGSPVVDIFPQPKRFVQTPQMLVILIEGDIPRQIHMDGRPLPEDPQPAWTGYSIGKWEDDTLVVETIGMNPRAPLDFFGHPRRESTRMIERMRRLDYGHMETEVTIIDEEYYSKPIRFLYRQTLVPDADLLEWVCTENERDAGHMDPPTPAE